MIACSNFVVVTSRLIEMDTLQATLVLWLSFFLTNVEFIQFRSFVNGDKSEIKAVVQNGLASVPPIRCKLFLPLPMNNCEGRAPVFLNGKNKKGT